MSSSIFEAVKSGDYEKVNQFILNGGDVRDKEEEGYSLLHWAWIGGGKMAKALINAGAEVNAKNSLGCTPLHEAAFEGALDTVKVLIEGGADVNAKDSFGNTPLHDLSALPGRLEIVNLLIKNNADVNAKDLNGWTPLHFAAQAESIEVAKVLLENGADPNAKESEGLIPIDFLKGNQELSKLLRKHAE